MGLFDDSTVIIVGAGASVPFGLPTGLSIMDGIGKSLRKEAKECLNFRGYLYDELQFPYGHSVFKRLDGTSPTYDLTYAMLNSLADWIDSQTSDTVDDLIRLYPDRSAALKVCVAYEILKCTHFENNIGNFELKSFAHREFPSQKDIEFAAVLDPHKTFNPMRNWIHQLINIARDELIELRKQSHYFNGKKVKIVSFNYDGILEFVLAHKWNGSGLDLPSYDEVFEIIHPHGTFPVEIGIQKNALSGKLTQYADSIWVVKEEVGGFDNPAARARVHAKQIVQDAVCLYSIGFAFAKANCETIGLDKGWGNRRSDRRIHYINYEDSYGLRNRVGQFGLTDEFFDEDLTVGRRFKVEKQIYEYAPKFGEKLEIHEALMAGFLGEMPF